jgi:hypothetical protein
LQQAISEYQQAGETPPASSVLARVYDEWGEHQGASSQYAATTATFTGMLSTYTGAAHEVVRAQAGVVATYIAWGRHAAAAQQYAEAMQHLDTVLGLSYVKSPASLPRAR